MKRKTKTSSTLYSFLEAQGVLETGNSEVILNAKKKYWAEYRRKWKKARRQERQSFDIFFSFKEMKIVTREAKKYHISITGYIKRSALMTKQIFDPVAVGEIRELLFFHHNSLESLSEENISSQHLVNQLVQQIVQIEKKVLGFFQSNNHQ
jgi:hypothetical protein